jgi:copper(I)-binding protein
VKAILTASLLLLASCGKGGAPDIQIADAWARETVAGQSGTAGYATIANRGSGNDRLVGISAQAPIGAMLHETTTSGSVSSMRPLTEGLEIPAGETVSLKPGGAHVMISGLTAPLKQGETLKLTFRFERSGDKTVDFKAVSAMSGMSH